MILDFRNMISKLKYILAGGLSLFFTISSAQESQVLYFMNLPQNHLANPALRPSNSVTVCLPGLSGFSLNLNNNFFNYSDVFFKSSTNDSVYSFLSSEAATDKFLGKVNKKNSFSPQLTVPLLGVGFKTGKGLYFFFDINERADGNAVLPGDVIRLMLKGNGSFLNDKIDLSSMRMDMKYYREYGLAVSKDINSKLRVGIRPRLFTGIMSTRFDNNSLGIRVNSDYTHSIDADVTANFAGPFNVYASKKNEVDSLIFNGDYFDNAKAFTNFENLGMGIDLGATYQLLNNKVTVSAALTDLGFIRWKRNVSNLSFKGNYLFDGLDFTDIISGDKEFSDIGDQILDTLKQKFNLTKTNDPYSTWLAPGLTLGGSYNLNKNVSFGLLSYTKFIGKQVKQSMTMSANLNVSNLVSLSFAYSLQNHRADNLGAGIAFRAGIMQFYLLSDRLPVTWNRLKIDDSSNIVIPSNWNTLNLRLGMNLCFGNKVKKKNDKPIIQNEQTF